jgi:hypothetical protein
LLWEAPNLLSGVTLANNAAIFRVRLKAVGAANTGSTVIFGEAPPTLFEVARVNSDSSLTGYNINQVALTQGFGAIGYTVSANEISGADDFSLRISPNPFSEKTIVSFDLQMACDVQITVADAAGRTLFDTARPQLQPGQHGIEIASPLLSGKGTCFLILRAGSRSCIRPLYVF